MQQPTYQTVKLGKGKHTSPRDGACVMELASMLAGERFTDHPRSVSPAIACLLRAYNDMLDDRRRQDLYAYAARVVGTAGSGKLERVRARRLVSWANARWERRARWSLFARLKRRDACLGRPVDGEQAARYASHTIGHVSDETHAAVLDLIDELIAIAPVGTGPTSFAEPSRERSVSAS